MRKVYREPDKFTFNFRREITTFLSLFFYYVLTPPDDERKVGGAGAIERFIAQSMDFYFFSYFLPISWNNHKWFLWLKHGNRFRFGVLWAALFNIFYMYPQIYDVGLLIAEYNSRLNGSSNWNGVITKFTWNGTIYDKFGRIFCRHFVCFMDLQSFY